MKWILLVTMFTTSFSVFSNQNDPVVAEVNGKTIKKSTLLSYHKQNLNFVRANEKVTIQSSLNDLIDRIIGIDNAKKLNYHKRPEVVKKMNDVVYHAYISAQLSPKLEKINVTDDDIRKYYKNNPEYKTSQILLRLRTLPSDKEVASALSTAKKIYDEAKKNPKKFADLAKQYGQTTTALAGGDMGYQPKTRLTPEYYEAIKGKRSGYIANPFRSQYGVHVVKVTGVKTYEQIDKDLYKKIIYDQKRDSILSKYFEQKRTGSKVKINKNALKL